jgi:hypothetical protein
VQVSVQATLRSRALYASACRGGPWAVVLTPNYRGAAAGAPLPIDPAFVVAELLKLF